jgi:3-methyladenine DNA glycosylase AlkD
MEKIIDQIRQELRGFSDRKTQETGQNFFKEQIKLYGVKTATVSKISKVYFQ